MLLFPGKRHSERDASPNTDSTLFLDIDRRLQEWRNNDLPFGGVGVIAMGDLFQLPPVAGTSLPHASTITGHPAGMLFSRFELVQLQRQMRTDDQGHLDQLNYFRNPAFSSTPIKDSKILHSLKTISSSDYESDPLWYDATIIVSENVTRVTLNRSQALLFAKKNNQPVISWRHTLADQSRPYFVEASGGNLTRLEEILSSIPDMTFYFVKGAPAVLKDNIWTSEGLVNGRMCHLHSLTLSGPNASKSWERIAGALPGEEVMLPEPPLSVNIQLETASETLSSLSIVDGITVLPLLEQRDSPRTLVTAKRTNSLSRMLSKRLRLSYFDFGLDLAFAVTYHKVQGRTLDRVIIDLASIGHISVAAFYVAISRTRRQEHIRILPWDNIISRRQLEVKKFDKVLIEWFATATNNEELLSKIGVNNSDINRRRQCSSDVDENDGDSAQFQSQRTRLAESDSSDSEDASSHVHTTL